MESLADPDKESENTDKLPVRLEKKSVYQAPMTTSKNRVQVPCKDEFTSQDEEDPNSDTKQVGCTPFFGVKHYLHNFYGLPDYDNSAKVWSDIENEEDYFAIFSGGQTRTEVECWHVHRRCFAWSMSIGTIIVLMGATCLLLGFLMPRQPILVNQIEESDLKTWIAAHSSEPAVTTLNILDRKAIEHNNILDILKVGGMMATSVGVLVLVIALIFPPSRHPSTWGEEEDTPHISQINQALKNCLRSFHPQGQQTYFYSGLMTSATDEKIPVFQQVQPIQPEH